MEQFGSNWTHFHEIWYLSIFRKSLEKIQLSLKFDNSGYFTWKPTTIHDNTSFHFPTARNISNKLSRENQNTYFMFKFFPQQIMPFMRLCGKMRYSLTGPRWQYNTPHAFCMLDNQRYKHTLRICNIYCFPAATMVTRTRLHITV